MRASIRRVNWDDEHTRLLAIRFEVFVEEQGVPAELEHDEHDARALHLLASVDDLAVATARMLDDGHIGRMAVRRAYRGSGIGGQLLRAMLGQARARGLREVFLHAQCSAEPFYENHGFIARGEVFVDAGIDHRTMVCRFADDFVR